MNIRLVSISSIDDAEEVVRLLSTNRFPFHVVEEPTEADARTRVTSGGFSEPENLAFWIVAGGQRVGFINFQEISDGAPMIDLRVVESHRGIGVGVAALRLGTSEIFEKLPDVNRIEGNTRADNRAMRQVFEHNGYVKEAHYREGWTVTGSEPKDSVAYAILRRDWQTGVTTPIDWNS